MSFPYSQLAGKTLFITGASRGIGQAIAERAARDGANIVIAAKTATPHPKLPGTIYTAAEASRFTLYPVNLFSRITARETTVIVVCFDSILVYPIIPSPSPTPSTL